MRNLFRALFVFALAPAATNCNGMTSNGPADETGTNFTACDGFRQALESKKCDVMDPRLIELVFDECVRRFARVEQECLPGVEHLYACFTEHAVTCPIGSVDCSAEERLYAECESGGTCQYTAAACELTEFEGAGTCPALDRICELTRDRCASGRKAD